MQQWKRISYGWVGASRGMFRRGRSSVNVPMLDTHATRLSSSKPKEFTTRAAMK